MEIKDYKELNALNKLLGTVKFQSDLDFCEFKEFVHSPIISEIFKRIQEEYFSESKKLGFVNEIHKSKFLFDSSVGKTLKLRVDELTENEVLTLIQNESLEFYIRTLISPLDFEDEEFVKLIEYAQERLK